MKTNKKPPYSVLAIASAGGHWVQLRRLQPAWKGCQLIYVSTSASRKKELMIEAKQTGTLMPRFFVVTEASRWEKLRLIKQLLQIIIILLTVRPDIIISTGAAPGFFSLKFGQFLGARTIWLDSIANGDELSLSGQKAGSCADLWLTQWPHLATNKIRSRKPHYAGTVI